MRLIAIHRHPVKGLTPERLERSRLQRGAGLPFDRAFAITSGNLPDVPVKGGWVPARSFIQLTVYPGLARFRCAFDDDSGTLSLADPDGETAIVRSGAPETFEAINRLMRRHFDAGPHMAISLHQQSHGHGHWDFADTAVSIINRNSVAALSAQAGAELDPRRFRGNLLVDLPAWSEFSLPGRRIAIGEAEIEVTRPAMRCAATAADPDTGDTSVNVPVALRKATGHLFCGVYGRVVKSGAIAAGDGVRDLGWAGFDPYADLPARTPDPAMWPRVAVVRREGGATGLESERRDWPLLPARPGARLRLHAGLGHAGPSRSCSVVAMEAGRYVIEGALDAADGAAVLVSGPMGEDRSSDASVLRSIS